MVARARGPRHSQPTGPGTPRRRGSRLRSSIHSWEKIVAGSETLQRRNEKLHAGIDAVTELRDRLGTLSPGEVHERLDQALAFFRHEIAPHARAEERVFYPEISTVLGIDLFERMVGDHRRISGLVADLTELRHAIATSGVVPDHLRRALTSLSDAVNAHLRLEEEALRRLERALRAPDLYCLYDRMEQAEFEAVLELSAPHATTSA